MNISTDKKNSRVSKLPAAFCLLVGISLVGLPEAYSADLTPSQVMEAAADVRKLEGSESVMTLTIVDEKGNKRIREIAMAAKMVDNNKTEKRLYRFLSPADVKGTGILAFDHENKNDEMWIFLPALRKTRSIASSEKSKNFMGSEFSYADMNTPILSNYKLAFKNAEKINGVDCYTIEVLPINDKVGSEEGYSKKIVWIGKTDFVIRQSHFYDSNGVLFKELTAKKVEEIKTKDGKSIGKGKPRYRAKYMEMTNKLNNRKSVFETTKIEYSPEITDDYFSTQYLERP